MQSSRKCKLHCLALSLLLCILTPFFPYAYTTAIDKYAANKSQSHFTKGLHRIQINAWHCLLGIMTKGMNITRAYTIAAKPEEAPSILSPLFPVFSYQPPVVGLQVHLPHFARALIILWVFKVMLSGLQDLPALNFSFNQKFSQQIFVLCYLHHLSHAEFLQKNQQRLFQ